MGLTAAAMGLWLLAGLAASRLRPPLAVAIRAVLIVLGIPLLGYATYHHGPLPGLAGLVLGTGVLVLHRLPRRRRAA